MTREQGMEREKNSVAQNLVEWLRQDARYTYEFLDEKIAKRYREFASRLEEEINEVLPRPKCPSCGRLLISNNENEKRGCIGC